MTPASTNTKLLFVCSRNQWRSRTAEEIFKNLPGYAVKSAGTEPSARIRVTEGLVSWADHILVMERKHRAILLERFPETLRGRQIHCLDIPDDYTYMDPDLVTSLQSALTQHLGIVFE
ncbi:MAG TPA: hypothetical protein VMZ30_16950 [Pyrinomonadaceae bacterium]|nr:hypothetical protein [Pyrinomonadaceae bacterium]